MSVSVSSALSHLKIIVDDFRILKSNNSIKDAHLPSIRISGYLDFAILASSILF